MSVGRCWLSVTVANRSITGLGIGLVVGLELVQLLQSSFVDFPVNSLSEILPVTLVDRLHLSVAITSDKYRIFGQLQRPKKINYYMWKICHDEPQKIVVPNSNSCLLIIVCWWIVHLAQISRVWICHFQGDGDGRRSSESSATSHWSARRGSQEGDASRGQPDSFVKYTKLMLRGIIVSEKISMCVVGEKVQNCVYITAILCLHLY